jgi:hypothetical protein
VVVTVTPTMVGVAPVRVAGLGETLHVDAVGAPVQAKLTLPEKPLGAVAVKLNVAVAPAVTVAEAVLAVTAKPVEPVPVRAIVCGLSLALSTIVRVPVRLPVVVGVKVTLTVQPALGPSDVPQSLVSEKSPLA